MVQQRGFQCACALCVRQRQLDMSEFASARASVVAGFNANKAVHNELYW